MRKSPTKVSAMAVATHNGGFSTQEGNLCELFEDLKARWGKDMAGVSNYARIISHPAYLRIIGQGSAMLPCIFDDLRAGGGPWFVALAAITGADPVKPRHRRNSSLMREDWLQWGRAHGYYA
jgi:hypothetical protein